MLKPSFHRVLHLVTRWGLALVFVVAGLLKLGDIPQFAARVGNFGLVADSLVTATAWIIAVAEVLAGLALGLNLRGSLSCVFVLLVVFATALGYGITLGLDVDCGCFGPHVHLGLRQQLLLDFGLLLCCGIVHWSRKNATRVQILSHRFR